MTSARTAMRNFDLQLAIATLRLPALSFMSRLERIRTIPVVYGGNRADPFLEEVRRRAAGLAHALAPIDRRAHGSLPIPDSPVTLSGPGNGQGAGSGPRSHG